MVSDLLLFWCSWFKYKFIKLDLVTVGKFCFHFNPERALLLRGAQNGCEQKAGRGRFGRYSPAKIRTVILNSKMQEPMVQMNGNASLQADV